MATRRVLIDTSILIEFFRKTRKEKSFLWKIKETSECYISSITLFELLCGVKTEKHREDIKRVTHWLETLYFDDHIAEMAASIFQNLKQHNQLMDHRDIFIAATAKYHGLTIATLNTGHFDRIEDVVLLDLT
jgi:tRNA(fMet)-specific endonuclease VapC